MKTGLVCSAYFGGIVGVGGLACLCHLEVMMRLSTAENFYGKKAQLVAVSVALFLFKLPMPSHVYIHLVPLSPNRQHPIQHLP